tara:strand:+ start:103 stop:1140 length:1038 start_codon:yes stop_codon:yes gene_type:complete
MSSPTIRDVAREAAVSVASVSRVINGHSNVRPEMRAKVEAAALALGFTPHAGARNLSLSRTGSIGVVLPDLHGEFFSELVRGMDGAASTREFQLLLSNVHSESSPAVAALRTMRGRVDGLVVMAPHIDPELLFAQLPSSLPVLLLNCGTDEHDHAELRIDNHAGAVAMTEHLIATGRRRIAHLAGPQDNSEARERRRGYEDVMRAHDLEPQVMSGDFLEASGTRAAEQILATEQRPDALFAANDGMAIGALVALRRGGLTVPGDIAVTGFDDIPLTRLVSPSVTTMSVDIAALGARAIERLCAIIDGGEDQRVEMASPRLVIRETCSGATGSAPSTTQHVRNREK